MLAIDIPKNRAFMHLDTVFTMVDYDKFTMHPNISADLRLFVLEPATTAIWLSPRSTAVWKTSSGSTCTWTMSPSLSAAAAP